MKVIVFVKATKSSEAGEMPSEQLLTEMTTYNEALVKAGIMLAGEGLKPSSQAVRVHFSGKNRTVIDGPFAETKELVAGFWIWEVKSMAEAVEWVKKCPNPMLEDSDIDIRPIFGMEDFGEMMTPELRERELKLQQQIEAAQVAPARFEEQGTLRIAGLKGSYTKESGQQIQELWMRIAPQLGKIPGQVDPKTYGVCWNYSPPCNFDYLAGVQLSSQAALPAGYTELSLAPQRYAVFVHGGDVSTLPALFDAIWGEWLPKSGLKAAEAPCFERYTEEFDPATMSGGIEVWVPLVK